MRPLYAIAPLAFALAMMAPSSQTPSVPDASLTQALVDWVLELTPSFKR